MIEKTTENQHLEALVLALSQRVSELEQRADAIEERLPKDKLSMVVFSGDLDKVLASFVISTGAAAMGLEVSMFFTFWGLNAVRVKKDYSGKELKEAMMAMMSPGNTRDLQPSKLAFFGAGSVMLRQMMKEKDIASLEELIELAVESGVRLTACGMSMDVMGVKEEELRPGTEVGGVAMFIGDASESKATLFI